MATKGFLIATSVSAVFLVYLWIEKVLHDRRLLKIPLRIGITGTRGKSSVTRLIAASLREAGMIVVAKTTGSRPSIILPDGSEREIRRRGAASILEQKKVVRLAARLGAQALIMEMMSIQRECLSAESRQLLKSGTLVLTNVRLDHLDVMGRTQEDIADCLAAAFPEKGTIVLPEEELFPVFQARAAKLGSKLVSARKIVAEGGGLPLSFSYEEFEENVRLALEVARGLGIEDTIARHGMSAVRSDFGSLKIWDFPERSGRPELSFVNAFAANDPTSTIKAVVQVLERQSLRERALIGLLNLREDRGDRSLQWAEALESGALARFSRIAVIGRPARAFALKCQRKDRSAGKVLVLGDKSPSAILERLSGLIAGPSLIVGMGNIGGLGEIIVKDWERIGKAHGL